MSEMHFESILSDEFRSLIAMKRALGYKYETDAGLLRRIDSFLVENGLQKKEISRELCEKWCRKRSYESPANHSSRISIMRVFCRYLSDIGIKSYIPPMNLATKAQKYDAHIYTTDELSRFFSAVDASKSSKYECPYRHLVMPVFFRILYTSGMRVSELRLSRVKDVNLADSCIFVKGGKNRKDRIVPIHPALVERCLKIKETIHQDSDENEFFFMLRPGREMTLQNVYHNFRRYLDKAGIPHTGKGPRVHDFRHTYCVHLLLKWNSEGKDLLAYLPYMRTMLGHESFEETAYYLKLTSEAYPFIRESLEKSFPSVIGEVAFSAHEFY